MEVQRLLPLFILYFKIMIKKTKINPLSTVLILIIALNIIFLISNSKEFLYASVGLGAIVTFSSKAANFVHKAWMGLAKILSYIVPNILLTIIFFLLLLPLSVISKIFRKGDLLNINKPSNSLWLDNERVFTKDYFEKPW